MEPTFLPLEPARVKLVLPHGPNESWIWGRGPKFDWCREHCKGKWKGVMYQRSQTEWYFESEHDAVLFSLRWS